MKDHLTVAAETAREAGEMLQAHFGKIETIEYKADRSLVTNLDKESERLVVERLLASFPGYGIIGEEGGSRESSNGYTWVIDPIDGTHNFIRSVPVYGVCIGLMREQAIVAGVIYMPSSGDLYAAETGGGAFKNDRKIAVSRYDSLETGTCSFDSGFRREGERMAEILKKISAKFHNVRMSGCSAWNLSLLAEGKLDAVVEFDDRIWDFTAGVAIIREAGGTVTTHKGNAAIPDHGAYIATNGLLHSALLQFVDVPV